MELHILSHKEKQISNYVFSGSVRAKEWSALCSHKMPDLPAKER